MSEFLGVYQYQVAWSIYLFGGCFFCLFWWRLTGVVKHGGWRDLMRGVTLVIIFTPWYVSEAHEHAAPAVVVALIDLLWGSADNGMSALLVLLIATALMLAILVVRRLLKK